MNNRPGFITDDMLEFLDDERNDQYNGVQKLIKRYPYWR